MSAVVVLPKHPRQGDVIEWWTVEDHPIMPYVQRHRATYYASAPCVDVLGPHYRGGRAFDQEWLLEAWYAPSGGKSAGGSRLTTEELRAFFTDRLDVGSSHATWEDARDDASARMRARIHALRAEALSLEDAATKLAATAAPELP